MRSQLHVQLLGDVHYHSDHLPGLRRVEPVQNSARRTWVNTHGNVHRILHRFNRQVIAGWDTNNSTDCAQRCRDLKPFLLPWIRVTLVSERWELEIAKNDVSPTLLY